MKVNYEKSFLKDIQNLDKMISLKLKEIILQVQSQEKYSDIKNIKKMIGYKSYYRIKVGNFRIGLKIEDRECIIIKIPLS